MKTVFMKNTKNVLYILTSIFVLIFMMTCEEQVFDNPFDAEAVINPNEWAPTNLNAWVISDSEIKLNWAQEESRISGFIIERQTNTSNFIQITKLNKNTTQYTDSDVVLETDYTYRLNAFTDYNESDYDTSNTTRTSFPRPTNLIAVYIDDQSIQLTWSDNSSFEKGFKIIRNENSNNWLVIADLPSNTSKYTDTGINFLNRYYYRVYAYTINNLSNYSNTAEPVSPEMTDIDGNVYHTIKIGNQVWMAENLKVTKYRDGTAIPNITNNIDWTSLSTGAYGVYDNDETNKNLYGYLYNYYAVDDSRNIAPEGWHVPTDDEWTTLIDFLGGSSISGGKMKEAGTAYWNNPNSGATNESGFTALPGGYRGYVYNNMGNYSFFWSSTESSNADAWTRFLYYNYSGISRNYYDKTGGCSVRCIRD